MHVPLLVRVKSRLLDLRHRAIALVFFCLLSLPLALFDRPQLFSRHALESSDSTPFPEFSLFWLQRLGVWFDGRYGLRDVLTSGGRQLQVRLLGPRWMNPAVVVGRDGWLFYDDGRHSTDLLFADLRGHAPFAPDELNSIIANLRGLASALASCGKRVLVVMVPDKQTIYPDFLPFTLASERQTRADQVNRALSHLAPNFTYIDLRSALKQARVAEPWLLYKKTDTHWNSLGAFFGYRSIREQLVHDATLGPSANSSLDAYKISEYPLKGGDIATNMLGLANEYSDVAVLLEPKRGRIARETRSDTSSSETSVYLVRTFTSANAGPRTLVYGDSFSVELFPFLAQDFAAVRFVVKPQTIDLAEVARFKADLVIIEVVERYLPTLRRPVSNLSAACR